MKCKLLLCIMVMFALTIPEKIVAQEFNNDLTGLTQIKKGVKTKRISSYDRSGGNSDRFGNIEDGETRNIFEVEGPGMINHIWITVAPTPDKMNRNDIIIKMYWDGEKFPSVESPLGAFFGQGWDESYNFASLPIASGPVNGRGMVCYFAMPFAKGAKIEIENQTGQKIRAFYYYVDYVEMESLPENTGRFHAWYNKELTEAAQEQWTTTGTRGKNKLGEGNYLIADIKGKGHFVGVNYYVHSPSPGWYGEGDDMIFIDGATEPTLHGTGTEDYFNTSWCPKAIYAHPYYGYARVNNDIGWLGRTHVYRFHISDPIYFDKSLKFTIEHGHYNIKTLDLASVAYWYQDVASPIPPIPGKEARKPMPLINPAQKHIWRHEWGENKGADVKLWKDQK